MKKRKIILYDTLFIVKYINRIIFDFHYCIECFRIIHCRYIFNTFILIDTVLCYQKL